MYLNIKETDNDEIQTILKDCNNILGCVIDPILFIIAGINNILIVKEGIY